MKTNLSAKKFNITLLVATAIFMVIASSIIINNLIQIKKDQLNNLLLQEESEIENILLERFSAAFFLIEKMGKEIVKNPDSKTHIFKVLEKYKSDSSLHQVFSWTIFSWSDTNSLITVDGEYGIMKTPVSLASRDYVQESLLKPWERLLGRPVYGSTSNKWMIPGGIGIADSKHKVLGTLTIGFDIKNLAEVIKNSLKDKNIHAELIYDDKFSVFSIKKSVISLNSTEEKIINNNGIAISKKLQNYPYSLALTYDEYVVSSILWEIIYSRIIEILAAVFLSLSLLWIIYKNESLKRREILRLMQREVFFNKSKSEFMMNLGHELKNFVAAISGLSNAAKEDLKDIKSLQDSRTKEVIDNLEHIDDIGGELNSFITDLIDLNQVDDGEFEIKKSDEVVDFEDLIERSVRILKSKIKNKNIVIAINCDTNLNKIRNLDQRRVKQILIGIIGNAIKFSLQNSKIDITANNIDQEKIAIAIKDYGVGMSDAGIKVALSKTEFDDGESNSIELKLPITKFLIERQGGSMEINSVKNRGTVVKIVF